MVAGWTREVEAARLAAERELTEATPTGTLTKRQIRTLVVAVRERLVGLDGATPDERAAIYQGTGLRLAYHPDENRLDVESRPACTQVRVGGGT